MTRGRLEPLTCHFYVYSFAPINVNVNEYQFAIKDVFGSFYYIYIYYRIINAEFKKLIKQ